MRNRDGGILELPVRSRMADAEFRNLASPAGGGVLVALPARLRVVERSESVPYRFNFVKFGLVGQVGSIVNSTVTLIIETGGRLPRLLG